MSKKFGETRFEYQTESSSKFWEPQLEGNALIVRFGRIGTSGQTNTKTLWSPAKAATEYRKLVCEKLVKGYKPTAKTVITLLDGAAPVKNPGAIASLCVAEHISAEVADDVCRWLTACIHHGMSPTQFKRTWEKFEEGDEELYEAFSAGEYQNWYDELHGHYPYTSYEIADLYAKAVADGGDRFVWLDDNSFVSVVALRGDPGAKAINKTCVSDIKSGQDPELAVSDIVGGEVPWPNELGPGAPIASVGLGFSAGYVKLRDGRYIEVQL